MGAVTLTPPLLLDRVRLQQGGRTILEDLSGSFQPGSLTALVGANGTGKTTLLRAIAGLHKLAGGRIEGGGPQRIALLPQGSQLDRGFPISCLDLVTLAAPRLGWFRGATPAQRQLALEALDRVGLAGLEGRSLQALSAGQFQRLLFARTMMQDAPVVLLDEPFTAVDTATAAHLLSVLQDWHAQGRTLIVVLHDMKLVQRHFPRTLLLTGDGHAVWGATAAVAPRLAA
ncbi:MAG: ATP-binding cassette domain-containing protein [Proteobacteria bacterium]|nr:ATP-binding cassette domain-containing protein [Pseudomonadota bacterium]